MLGEKQPLGRHIPRVDQGTSQCRAFISDGHGAMAAGGCRADGKPETASKCRGSSQLPSPQPLSEQQPAGLLTFLQRSRGAQSHAKRIPFPTPHTLQTPLQSVVINNSNGTTDDNRNEQSPFRATLSSFSLFSSLRRYLTTAVACSWTHRRLRRCCTTASSNAPGHSRSGRAFSAEATQFPASS